MSRQSDIGTTAYYMNKRKEEGKTADWQKDMRYMQVRESVNRKFNVFGQYIIMFIHKYLIFCDLASTLISFTPTIE